MQNRFFPLPFRFAVNTDWFCNVIFDVGLALFAIENVISAEMNELGFFVAADLGEKLWRLCVYPECLIDLLLTKIDIGECGAVDQNIEVERRESFSHSIEIGEIELRVIKTYYVKLVSILVQQSSSETAPSTDN